MRATTNLDGKQSSPLFSQAGRGATVLTSRGWRTNCWPIGDGGIPTREDLCEILFGAEVTPDPALGIGWLSNLKMEKEAFPAANWAQEWSDDRWERVFLAGEILARFERSLNLPPFLETFAVALQQVSPAAAWSVTAALARLRGESVAQGVTLDAAINVAQASTENLWYRMLWGRIKVSTGGSGEEIVEMPTAETEAAYDAGETVGFTLKRTEIGSTLLGSRRAPVVWVFPPVWNTAATLGLVAGKWELPEEVREPLRDAGDGLIDAGNVINNVLSMSFSPAAAMAILLSAMILNKGRVAQIPGYLLSAGAEGIRLNDAIASLLDVARALTAEAAELSVVPEAVGRLAWGDALGVVEAFMALDEEQRLGKLTGLTAGQIAIVADCLRSANYGQPVGDANDLRGALFLDSCLTDFDFSRFEDVRSVDQSYFVYEEFSFDVGLGLGPVIKGSWKYDGTHQWKLLGRVAEAARLIELSSYLLKGLLFLDDGGMCVAGPVFSGGGLLGSVIKERVEEFIPAGCLGELLKFAEPAELIRVLWRVHATESLIVALHDLLGTDDGCLYATLCTWYNADDGSLDRMNQVLGPREFGSNFHQMPTTSCQGVPPVFTRDGLVFEWFPGRRFEEGILYRVLFQSLLRQAYALRHFDCDRDAQIPPRCLPGVDVTCREMEVLQQWFLDQKASCMC